MFFARDLLVFLDIRLRHSWRLEILRIYLQFCFGFVLALCLASAVFWPWLHEPPWSVPSRIFHDTFVVQEAWGPPLLDRSRFETSENLWRPLTFSSKGRVGRVQDKFYRFWNWEVRSLWNLNGSPWERSKALVVAGIFCNIVGLWYFFGSRRCGRRLLRNRLFKATRMCIKRNLLMYWPERLLILEQLHAAKRFGRRLSAASRLELGEEEETEMLAPIGPIRPGPQIVGQTQTELPQAEESATAACVERRANPAG